MPQKGNNSFKNFIKFQNSKINKKIRTNLKFKIFQYLKIKKKKFKFSKISVFIKFQNFNIQIIILKNDKTIIAYHFGQ